MVNGYSIGFYGDFTTGENYQAKAERLERTNVLRQYGYDYLFQNVEVIFNSFDMNIVNLETPLTNETYSALAHKKTVLHWADKEILPKYLKKYKIEAVSLGNNHAMDYEKKGLCDTLKVLTDNNIYPFGAGLNIASAQRPFIKRIILGDSFINLYVFGGYKYKKEYDEDFNYYADVNKEGVFCLTPESVKDIISAVKENDKNSLIVIFPHFGYDLLKTTDLQRDYAYGFIDAGADIVIGHGPHMMNSIEIYKNKPILYGLGNFIFPADFGGKPISYNMAAELRFFETENGIKNKLYIYPVYMDNQSYKTQTRPISAEELEEFTDLLVEGVEDLRSILKAETVDNIIRIELQYENK
ncbi:MAG: CapA family protein [Candidatus Gastranaerophilaceae bacterium]